jgi:FixJ family two-component response regulator
LIVAPRASEQTRLRKVIRELGEGGVAVLLVDEPGEAASQVSMSEVKRAQCVMLDASAAAAGGRDAIALIVSQIEALSEVDEIAVVVIATAPAPRLVIRAFRAGATDFIDLATETAPDVMRALERVVALHEVELDRKGRIRGMRAVLDDFLKGLVQTERRTIDLEEKLAAQQAGATEQPPPVDPNREPVVFIVEDDRDVADRLVDELESVAVTTFAFVSGEEAVSNASSMASRSEPIDLALVDARLPGMNGLEAIKQMRRSVPNLSAMLMTGFSDSQTAISAADLGVVGYVLKPFDDIPALIKRIKGHAVRAMILTREQRYLEQIKQRHEKVLMRYRALAPELDRLV